MSAFFGVYFKGSLGVERARAGISEVKVRIFGDRALADGVWSEGYVANGFVVHYDLGAYGQGTGFQSKPGSLTVLAGHPYLDSCLGDSRLSQTGALVDAVTQGGYEGLRAARGSYAMAHLSQESGSLLLVTDVLGIRPLYYAVDGECVVFATTISVVRKLLNHPIEVDLRGTTETAVMGFALGERTTDAAIHCVEGGVALEVSAVGITRRQYWRWKQELKPPVDEPTALKLVYETFLAAVRIRLEDDRESLGFLTGGLDSRCVVSAVQISGAKVQTINFAETGSQDLELGASLAAAMGVTHYSCPMPMAPIAEKIAGAMTLWRRWLSRAGAKVARQSIVWSGDGGSLGLGHIYLNDEIVTKAKSGLSGEAVSLLISENFWVAPVGIFKDTFAGILSEVPMKGLMEELRALDLPANGRDIHALLMVTDQRRHMHDHYERIYEHGCEMHLPFFDRDFVTAVLSQPIQPFLAHRFYNRWLTLFPKEVSTVAWQAYPLHEPCPLPIPEGLHTQWSAATIGPSLKQRIKTSWVAATDVLAGHYRGTPVSALKLLTAALLTGVGFGDYSYALKAARHYRARN